MNKVIISAWVFNYSMTLLSKEHGRLLSSGCIYIHIYICFFFFLSIYIFCIVAFYGLSPCCCVAGLRFCASAALGWTEIELPNRPAATLWCRLVFPLNVSPPVGQWGTLLGAKEPGGVWSDAHVSSLPSGNGFWCTALAWGWHRHL